MPLQHRSSGLSVGVLESVDMVPVFTFTFVPQSKPLLIQDGSSSTLDGIPLSPHHHRHGYKHISKFTAAPRAVGKRSSPCWFCRRNFAINRIRTFDIVVDISCLVGVLAHGALCLDVPPGPSSSRESPVLFRSILANQLAKSQRAPT